MRLVIVWMIATACTFGLVFEAAAQGKGNRPTDLISADVGVSKATFIACFADVQPAVDKSPSADTKKTNKSVLLPCLQAANPDISKTSLDRVMDHYRPEGPYGRS